MATSYVCLMKSDNGRVGNLSVSNQSATSDVINASGLNDELYDAAEKGQTSLVIALLKRGASIHADEDAALQIAAQNGHPETVSALLDAGANIHAGNELYDKRWCLEWSGHKGSYPYGVVSA